MLPAGTVNSVVSSDVRLGTREVRFGNSQLSLILGQRRLGLSQVFAEGPRVDLEQQIALIDIRAFSEFHAEERPVDLGFHLDCRGRFDSADRPNLYGHGFFSGLTDRDRNRRKRGRSGLGLRCRTAENADDDCNGEYS